MNLRNQTIDKIIKALPYKSVMDGQFWRSWKVSHIFDYRQNYCVYLDNKDEMEVVKEKLKAIGASKFRVANRGYALCFYIEEVE
jgi:hypothetical protein